MIKNYAQAVAAFLKATIALTIATMFTATAALAGGSNFEGTFGGSAVSTAITGSLSATGNLGGGSSWQSNGGSAGQLSGAMASLDMSKGSGTLTTETFVDGFSKSFSYGSGGAGGSFASNFGAAEASGEFWGKVSGKPGHGKPW